MSNILVTGASGQIGSELVVYLAKKYGNNRIIATDIKEFTLPIKEEIRFQYLDVLDQEKIQQVIEENNIDIIYHMAAILSAVGEKNPQLAYEVNMQGLMNILEASRKFHIKRVLVPSSIAAFGPDAPKERTPDNTVMNPTTMYGVTKVAGEKLCQYYYLKYGVDVRSVRYPGIISSETLPGGGTTDYAVDLYIYAVQHKPYECYINAETTLPFMYMPDAISAIVNLEQTAPEKLTQRVYNIHAMSLNPAQIVSSIRKIIPDFQVTYKPDFREKIAQSWPKALDDSAARRDWGWAPRYDIEEMTLDMINKLKQKL
ncbi:MAG: L-threonine 3-dehydrogenase [Calditrichia bacterium]